ncbi:molybdopterin molybdotransferase MoeA [Brachybacterium conglomeratum]|uniref:molybdopterin molybdotransferase MoeA n=1 Tax=Brachybacterium conglomeratum TaxID=47846 RepID=UPI003D9FD67D
MSAERLSPWQWREEILTAVTPPGRAERVPLEQARGRVLAAAVRSPEQVPALPIAAMDGFAVRRADLTAPGTTVLPVAAELPARPGEVPDLPPGSAARIMTGAPVPRSADAVIEVEATDSDPFGPAPAVVALDLEYLPVPGRHVRGPGEEIPLDAPLALAGDRVGAGLVGLARTLGIDALEVLRPLRVTVVVTGDELTAGVSAERPGADTRPGAVRESNGSMLAAALAADGAHALPPRHCGDDPADLRETLDAAAREADLVLTTGGIGHGAYDVVKLLLGERGAGTSRFAHLALRPGGPQGHGTLPGGVPVVHLPGTPVGALVGYHLFVRPLLDRDGAAPRRMLLRGEGDGPRRGPAGTVHALPGRREVAADGREVVRLVPGRRLAPYGRADAMVLLESAGPVGGADDGGAGPDGGAAPGSGESAEAPERSVLVLVL